MKQLTLEAKQFIRSIRSLIGKATTVKEITSLLKERGFIRVDDGAYKYVYRRGDDPYCVKVYRNRYGWKHDSFKVPKHLSKYYLHPVFVNKRFIIQKWAEPAKNLKKKELKKIPKTVANSGYDLHGGNIRIDGKREVIIDFIYNTDD